MEYSAKKTEIKPNTFFHADALSVVERIPTGVASIAFLDPPWETSSNNSFKQSRTDDSGDELAAYLSKIGQQMHRVLTEKGSLFIHWSSTSTLDIRLIMNQIFGGQPKYEIILINKKANSSVSHGPKNENFVLLVYSKSNEFIYNNYELPLSEGQVNRYQQKDEIGFFSLNDLTIPLARPSQQYEWHGFTLPAGRAWRYNYEILQKLYHENRIYFPASGGLPRLKRYLDEAKGDFIGSVWDDIPMLITESEKTSYHSQLPLSLLERVIKLASNEKDIVVDPFCGSGTTLVAAYKLNRRWIGIDNDKDAAKAVVERLSKDCNLESGNGYLVEDQNVIEAYITHDLSYRDIITHVREIEKLQQKVIQLTSFLFNLRELMGIADDANELSEDEVIAQMEMWISKALDNQRTVDSYIPLVKSWLTGWDLLHESSQVFLPQAELLYQSIKRTEGRDYAPFVIQYCRALENELLTKLFSDYTDDLYERNPNVTLFIDNDLKNQSKEGFDKISMFAKSLKKKERLYTLGQMQYILSFLKSDGNTLKSSSMLQDFRDFTVRYFSEKIVEKHYLDQIQLINKDYRNKSAHPYIIDAQLANRCRKHIQTCLNELISNYSHFES